MLDTLGWFFSAVVVAAAFVLAWVDYLASAHEIAPADQRITSADHAYFRAIDAWIGRRGVYPTYALLAGALVLVAALGHPRAAAVGLAAIAALVLFRLLAPHLR